MHQLPIKKQQIEEAHQRIKPYVHKTPILSSTYIAKITKCQKIYLKCQNLQKVGAFKARGAFNKLLQIKQKQSAVCTHSSGNHAQAVALAASVLNRKSYIIMPQNSPSIKKKGVQGYKGEVIICGNSQKQRQQTSQKVSKQKNAIFIPPYNDLQIITGQATAAKQIFQQLKDLDYLVFPIGGGGLGSGTLLSNLYFGGKCKAIGVEPQLASDALLSLKSGNIQPQMPPITIADGLRTSLGSYTFNIIRQLLKPQDLILVKQSQIIQATQLVMQRMKIVIEPSSATVVAAVLKDKRFVGKKVCCLISGGNIDLSYLFESLQKQIKL